MNASAIKQDPVYSGGKVEFPFAEKIYQTIFDLWLMENLTVPQVKQALKDKKMIVYELTPSEIERNTKMLYNTHLIKIPSLNLFLFPRKNCYQILSLFKMKQQIFRNTYFMNKLIHKSEIISVLERVYFENDLSMILSVSLNGKVEIKIYAK